jgi:hypothetical protein
MILTTEQMRPMNVPGLANEAKIALVERRISRFRSGRDLERGLFSVSSC